MIGMIVVLVIAVVVAFAATYLLGKRELSKQGN